MQRSLEQCYVIKFCAKLGKSGSETLLLLRTAYGDAVLSSAWVFRWHKAFKDGRESVEDKQRTVRPSTSRSENNVARGKAVLDTDQHLNVWLIAEEVELPKTDVHWIIDLHMRKICVKLVPKNLSDEQKDNHVLVSRELLDCVTSEPGFLQWVITEDETWIFEYNPTTKRQSSEWHTYQSPRTKKARMSKSRVKTMLIIFLFKGSCSQGVCTTRTDCESNILPTGTQAFKKQSCARPPWNCKHVVPSPWQCAKSHINCCEGIFASK